MRIKLIHRVKYMKVKGRLRTRYHNLIYCPSVWVRVHIATSHGPGGRWVPTGRTTTRKHGLTRVKSD